MDPVPRFKMIDAGPMAPLASAGPAIAQANATARLGQAIQGIGEMGFQIAEKVRRTSEAGKMSAFMANLDEEANRFSLELTRRPDPEGWVEDWQARQQEFKQRAGELGLSREASAALQIELNDWNSQRGIRFETQAFTRMTMEGKARISNSFNYHASRNDAEGMRRDRDRMRDAGFEESEIEKASMEAERIANKSVVDQRIQDDPAAVLDDVQADDFLDRNPGLTAYDQEFLEREAANRLADLRGEDMEKLDEAFKDGSIRPADIEAAPNLTPADRAAYAKHMAKATPPTREELATQWDRLDVLRRARNDPGMTPEMYRDIYYETKAGVLNAISPNYQGELSKELSYLSPAGRSASMESGPDAPVTKEDLLGIGRSMISRARSANAFGDIENGTPEVKEKAWRQAEDAELELKRFVAANPAATPDDIRAHADALISGTRTNSAKQSLRSFVPGSGGSLRGAVFPPVKPSKNKLDGGVDAPAGQGESDDLLLPPREDLDQFLNDGN